MTGVEWAIVAVAVAVPVSTYFYSRARSRARAEVIRQLSDGEWHRGLDMVKASNGLLRRGTVYVHLTDLEDKGLIESRPEEPLTEGGPRARSYRSKGRMP